MFISPNERIILLIDGPYVLSTCRSLLIDIDFKRVLDLFRAEGRLTRAHFYALTGNNGDTNSLRPLLDWLDYNGYTTTARPADRSLSGVELDLAVDALRLSAAADHLVIFSGAADLTKLVYALKDLGKRVTLVGGLASPVAVADELRRAADQFVDIAALKDRICRETPRPRRP